MPPITSSLKAEQIASDVNLLESTVTNVASRAQILNAIKRYTGEIGGTRNTTYANWNTSLIDFSLVLSTQLALQHLTVFSSDFKEVYLNITSEGVLPANTQGFVEIQDATGNRVGFNSLDGHPGFPDELFPKSPPGRNLFIGPVRSLTNSSAHIASITVPIYNNTTSAVANKSILGYVTAIVSVFNIENTISDEEGLGETGKYLLIGPQDTNVADEESGWPGNVSWRYVLPPIISTEGEGNLGGWFPQISTTPGFKGSLIDTRNPANHARVAIGFAPVNYSITTWMLIIQQDHGEVSQPINHLRNLLLATVFGTAAGVVVVTCILATYAIRPIARLRDATEKTTRPPGYSPTAYDSETEDPPGVFAGTAGESTIDESIRRRRPWWRRGFTSEKIHHGNARNRKERSFRVPDKVPDKKHFVTDELTDLTRTFNEMTDELVKQYTHLEERVATRTAELKEQTQLANAANDAKSMFIANVTHELRTPLNGILGMCSVMLTETNLAPGVKRSLNTIYKSGDLLLCLLTDLLTFSRNQVAGVNVVLEEGEFHVRDLITQVKAIFVKTARDKGVELGVEIVKDSGNAEAGEASVHGVLRGDINRILQVVINLLSNALKFTPEKGSVQLRIAMLEDTRGVALTTDDTPQKDMPTLKMPQTAIINPNTPANMALKAKKEATSLTIPSLTTPGEISNSSTTEAYFDESNRDEDTEQEDGKSPADDPRIVVRWFEFSVIDTGPGIPGHMHTKIFEPFVQGDLGLSKKYGGTGLGLSICKQLAELMGGVIELKSFEGAGSTFTLRIPLKAGGFASQPSTGYSRPGSLATTRYTRNLPPNLRPRGDIDNISTKSASTAFSSISGGPADATRLVGLSQPFFAPEVVEDENYGERRQSRSMEKRQRDYDHSPPPPPLPSIPPYTPTDPQSSDRTDALVNQRRPALERTSSSPAMLTPRSLEGTLPGTRKSSEDQGGSLAPTTTGASAPLLSTSIPPPVAQEPTTPKHASPPPIVTVSPSKSVRISKVRPQTHETPGESSATPKKEKEKRSSKELKELKEKRASVKVLVAEDNRVNIQVIKKMLRLEAVTDVTLAEDGAIAIEKVKEAITAGKKFDIIFMDIQMPNVDGLQATKAIREMGYTSAICALTAFAEQSNVKECFDAGMDYFLAKPIKKNELRKALQRYGASSALMDTTTHE
ncbi:hypothetical protein ABW19_dt0200910 [Dactylella cylindrospora]|nr:hypothetical protein ABW19_dt0200910 [Dactylella cylindrospora]